MEFVRSLVTPKTEGSGVPSSCQYKYNHVSKGTYQNSSFCRSFRQTSSARRPSKINWPISWYSVAAFVLPSKTRTTHQINVCGTSEKDIRIPEDVITTLPRNIPINAAPYLQKNRILSTTRQTNIKTRINLLKPTGYVMHQQFNFQQLYVLPTLYLCVLYLSEKKRRLAIYIHSNEIHNVVALIVY